MIIHPVTATNLMADSAVRQIIRCVPAQRKLSSPHSTGRVTEKIFHRLFSFKAYYIQQKFVTSLSVFVEYNNLQTNHAKCRFAEEFLSFQHRPKLDIGDQSICLQLMYLFAIHTTLPTNGDGGGELQCFALPAPIVTGRLCSSLRLQNGLVFKHGYRLEGWLKL